MFQNNFCFINIHFDAFALIYYRSVSFHKIFSLSLRRKKIIYE